MEIKFLKKHEEYEKQRTSYLKRKKVIIFSVIGVICFLILFFYLYSFTDIIIRLPKSLSSTSQPGEWAMFRHDPYHSGFTGETNALPEGELKWTFTTGDSIYSSPAVANGKVYVGSRDGKLYALDADTGDLVWQFQTGSWVDSSPAVANGVVYFGSNDAHLYALDANTGEQLWAFDAVYALRSSPAVAGDKVFFGADDSKVYAINTETGKKAWSFETDKPVASSPVISEGVLLVGSRDNYCYVLNAHTGGQRLKFRTYLAVTTSPVIQDGIGYIVNSGGRIWAIDITARNWILEKGTTDLWRWAYIYGIAPKPPSPSGYIWSHILMAESRCSPMISGNVLYVGAESDLVALSIDTQEEIWRFQSGGIIHSSPSLVGNTIYFGSDDGNLYALDADSGAVVWEYFAGAGIESSPAVADGVLYVGCNDGKLYAIE